MPRRSAAITQLAASSTPHASSPALPAVVVSLDPNVQELRRQWKWAAFSQFFFTFGSLFNMADVTANVSFYATFFAGADTTTPLKSRLWRTYHSTRSLTSSWYWTGH